MKAQPAAARAEAASATPVLLREDEGEVAVLMLNRPHAGNSLSEELLAALSQALAALAGDHSVRAVVLGASGKVFCAGHDLKELTAHRNAPDRGREYFRHVMDTCSAMMQAIVALPKPVIAAVGGTATAAGCQLVASCDLAVASTAARFATPGVDIGLFCSTPMVALSRNVAPKHAMEMLLTGEAVSAEEAARIGLVNRVVSAGREREEAMALARTIASKSALTVKIGKEAFYRQLDMSLADAYAFASQTMVENMLARDAEEGIGAFIEKRQPKWQDR
jgi:enoyl-CoA hydratase/carnithine racemase